MLEVCRQASALTPGWVHYWSLFQVLLKEGATWSNDIKFVKTKVWQSRAKHPQAQHFHFTAAQPVISNGWPSQANQLFGDVASSTEHVQAWETTTEKWWKTEIHNILVQPEWEVLYQCYQMANISKVELDMQLNTLACITSLKLLASWHVQIWRDPQKPPLERRSQRGCHLRLLAIGVWNQLRYLSLFSFLFKQWFQYH